MTTMREAGTVPRRSRRRRVQDAAALFLICVGLLGTIVTAFAWFWLAGLLTFFLVLVAVGVYTGLE